MGLGLPATLSRVRRRWGTSVGLVAVTRRGHAGVKEGRRRRMRSQFGRLGVLVGLALCARTALGQTIPTGFQDYYLIGHDEQLWEMFDHIQERQAPAADFVTPEGMNSIITLTAQTDLQV